MQLTFTEPTEFIDKSTTLRFVMNTGTGQYGYLDNEKTLAMTGSSDMIITDFNGISYPLDGNLP